jgi:hypothetical protein
MIVVVGEGLLVRARLFTISGSDEILLKVLAVQQAGHTDLGPAVLCYVLCRFSAGLLYAVLLLGTSAGLKGSSSSSSNSHGTLHLQES